VIQDSRIDRRNRGRGVTFRQRLLPGGLTARMVTKTRGPLRTGITARVGAKFLSRRSRTRTSRMGTFLLSHTNLLDGRSCEPAFVPNSAFSVMSRLRFG
jgi:hypothetical protein